jgi:hypothetical protein
MRDMTGVKICDTTDFREDESVKFSMKITKTERK